MYDTYQRIINVIKNANEGVQVGFTATPNRRQEGSAGRIHELHHQIEIATLIRGFVPPATSLWMSGCRMNCVRSARPHLTLTWQMLKRL